MTELEKLKTLVSLTTVLYQHTDLKIAPSWFSGYEDNGYDSECYHIGWQNKNYWAEIELMKKDKVYQFMFFTHSYVPFKNEVEYVSIKEILEYKNFEICEKLKKLVNYINDNFKEGQVL